MLERTKKKKKKRKEKIRKKIKEEVGILAPLSQFWQGGENLAAQNRLLLILAAADPKYFPAVFLSYL